MNIEERIGLEIFRRLFRINVTVYFIKRNILKNAFQLALNFALLLLFIYIHKIYKTIEESLAHHQR